MFYEYRDHIREDVSALDEGLIYPAYGLLAK